MVREDQPGNDISLDSLFGRPRGTVEFVLHSSQTLQSINQIMSFPAHKLMVPFHHTWRNNLGSCCAVRESECLHTGVHVGGPKVLLGLHLVSADIEAGIMARTTSTKSPSR